MKIKDIQSKLKELLNAKMSTYEMFFTKDKLKSRTEVSDLRSNYAGLDALVKNVSKSTRYDISQESIEKAIKSDKDSPLEELMTLISLEKIVPERFWYGGGDRFIIHHKGTFLEIVYNADIGLSATVTKVPTEAIEAGCIAFDCDVRANSFSEKVGSIVDNLKTVIEEYEDDVTYNKNKYVKVVTEEVKVPESEIYSPDYSLTKEEGEKLDKWMKAHDKKYHRKGHKYTGAIGVSNFELNMGWTSVGEWIDCECTECKKAGVDRKTYVFEIRGLD